MNPARGSAAVLHAASVYHGAATRDTKELYTEVQVAQGAGGRWRQEVGCGATPM